MARAKVTNRRITKSAKAGLTFPMTRVRNMFKSRIGKSMRIGWGAAAYATAVMEYLTAEVLEISGHVCKDFKLRRLNPRHILLAIMNDAELARLLDHVTIPAGGVVPNIQPALIPAQQKKQMAIRATKPVVALGQKPKQQTAKAKVLMKVTPKVTKAAATKAAIGSKRKHQGVTILGERVLTNGQKLSVLSADIVNVKCDAIVNPSSSNYSLSGQVGSRLSQVGGAAFQQNVTQMKGSIGSNQAAMCDGVNFAADYVIFCNGPSWGNNPATSIPALESTVANCLKLAESKKLDSVCFPSIGSGVGGFPKQTAAQSILRAIAAFYKQKTNTQLKQIYFDLYDQESINVYVTELARMQE